MNIVKALCGLCVVYAAGCDTRAPGGSPVPQGPTSILGKARQSGKDINKKVSEGGNDKEAVMLNAQIKIDGAAERLSAYAALPGEDAKKRVRVAKDKLALARSAVKTLENTAGAGEQAAKDKVRAALAELADALAKVTEE